MIKTRKVRFLLAEVSTDPNQYKPYMHKLTSDNVYVEVEVPAEEVSGTKEIVLTVTGLTALLETVADSLEKMNNDRRKRTYGH